MIEQPIEVLKLPPAEAPYPTNEIYDVPLVEIFADEEFNCRGTINPIDVADMANDILQKGLIQPILLQPWTFHDGRRWRIVAGYRRYKAVRMNKIAGHPNSDTIRAIIREGLGDLDARVLNLSENLQRENLNIMQEANAIDHFRRAGWTEQQTADKMKMSRGWVQARFRLLELPPDIQKEVQAGMISQTQIQTLHRLKETPNLQYALVRKIKDAKILGKKRVPTESSIVMVKNAKKPRTPDEIFAIQDIVIEHFGHGVATKVLGWAGGAISDLEMHKYFREKLSKDGVNYEVPTNFKNAEPSNPTEGLTPLPGQENDGEEADLL